ncbi:MAG TPA: flavodoxin domain-containing protein [Streptosporangiaceae bacterium]|nr:flavodoxin domain-containing protein [Streptosporangiaceae bacterium]
MRAVVVYESMYGNTHLIADAIGTGLAQGFDVTVVPVADADKAVVADADLVVVGGPTHVHGMSRSSTRKGAVDAAAKAAGELTLEPGAGGPGLREWLDALGKCRPHAKAAAFDTRMAAPAAITGRASKGVGRELRHHGFELVTEPESFIVTKENHLVGEEGDRARTWGARLAAIASPAGRPVGGS